MTREVAFVAPGRLETLTGGYGYDRRLVAGLRARGWTVAVHELAGGFPAPDAAARRDAGTLLAALPDAAAVVIDGLALGALPHEVTPHASRLRIIALVHHPLADETGLDAETAARLEDSERLALRAARHVVVTSTPTKARLAHYGVAPDRVSVIEPGTDAASPARGSAASDGSVHLLCVATLIPRKGHDVLLRALAAMPHRHWRLTCVGSLDRDPATVARLRAQVAELDLAGRVALVGERDTAALAVEYDSADVFVLPTHYEGYGMVVAEALAHGLPIVATDTGAAAALVGDEAGVVVPPGDVEALAAALARVVGDARVRAQLAQGARYRRSHLPTWDDACRRMEVVLRR